MQGAGCGPHKQSLPLPAAFQSWLEAVLSQVSAKSTIALAIRYALKRWEALVPRFISKHTY